MFLANIGPWGEILIWLAIVIIAVIVELESAQLVSIWFALSAIVAMVLAAFKCSTVSQVLTFAILSLVLLLFTRPIAKKLMKTNGKTDNSTIESMIGEEVVVTKEIPLGGVGEIKAKYDKFSAIAPSATDAIGADTKVIVKEIRGNKVIVDLV